MSVVRIHRERCGGGGGERDDAQHPGFSRKTSTLVVAITFSLRVARAAT